MFDFSIGKTFHLLLRTLPYVGLRLGVYLGIALAYLIVMGICAAFGMIAGGSGAGWGAFIGFVLASGVLYWARAYLLYLVKAGHIAVMMEMLAERPLPEGRGQIAYGRDMVKRRFASTSVLFGVDRLVRGILRVFHRVTMTIADFIPIPGLDTVVSGFDRIIKTALTNLDEVILGQIFLHPDDSAWSTACDSVVLYAQTFKGIAKNAVFLTFIVWGLTVVLFLVIGLPLAALIALVPGLAGFWTLVVAAVIIVCLKAALIDPFAMTALLQVYAHETRGKTPDPVWTDRLTEMSDKFRELASEAANAVRGARERAAAHPRSTPPVCAPAPLPASRPRSSKPAADE